MLGALGVPQGKNHRCATKVWLNHERIIRYHKSNSKKSRKKSSISHIHPISYPISCTNIVAFTGYFARCHLRWVASLDRKKPQEGPKGPTRWDNDLCQTSGIETKKHVFLMTLCVFILNGQSIYIYTHQNVFLARTKAASWRYLANKLVDEWVNQSLWQIHPQIDGAFPSQQTLYWGTLYLWYKSQSHYRIRKHQQTSPDTIRHFSKARLRVHQVHSLSTR